jgi:hypothetical protein
MEIRWPCWWDALDGETIRTDGNGVRRVESKMEERCMKWLIVHDGWDNYIGPYRTFYVNKGYYSDDKNKAKRFSWFRAMMEVKRIKRGCPCAYEDKYFVVKDV